MCKIDIQICRICLRNSENCNMIDSSSFSSVFSQLIGVKVSLPLWLCTWCIAILKRTVLLQKIAMESQEILKKMDTISLKSNTHPCMLTYHTNQNLDIYPIETDNMYDSPDAKLNNDLDNLEDITAVDVGHSEASTASLLIEKKVVKKKNKEYFKSLGFEVEYLSIKEQEDEIDNMKVSSKYLDMKYKCSDCGIGFMIADDYEEHALRHKPENGPHACSICKLRYKTREVFWQHRLAHSRRFTCVHCSRRLKRVNRHRCGRRGEHYLVNVKKTQRKNYICHQCDKSFASKQRLKIHLRSHTGTKPFECSICSRTFTTNSNLRTHAAVHSDNKPHYCVECNTYYKTEKNLKRHFALSTRHIKIDEMAFSCSDCPKRFTSEKILQNHIKVLHKTSYKCTHCDKNFYNNANLKKHIRCIHSEIK